MNRTDFVVAMLSVLDVFVGYPFYFGSDNSDRSLYFLQSLRSLRCLRILRLIRYLTHPARTRACKTMQDHAQTHTRGPSLLRCAS
jgi:hypothetical protein